MYLPGALHYVQGEHHVYFRDTFTNQSVNAVKYVQVIQHFRSVSTTMNEILSSLIKQVITKY